MKELKKEELKKALIDVRKSYRLLYAYQRRILDLVKFIGEYYGLTFDSHELYFSDGVGKKSKSPFNKWAWDWLGMYRYCFNFNYKEQWPFYIFIQSDSGRWEENNNCEATDIDNFFPAIDSFSRIIFIIDKKWEWKFGEECLEILCQGEKDVCLSSDKNCFGKSYDLSELHNEENTKTILKDFSLFSKKNNINLYTLES